MSGHFVSVTCGGEWCKCGRPAAHKVGEEIPRDDPSEKGPFTRRHNFTAYVCCRCFRELFGPAVFCEDPAKKQGTIKEAFQALRDAGGDGWDAIDDPRAFLDDAPAGGEGA